MFISKTSAGGYTRGGEQRSGRGLYLALFSWNKFKAADEVRAECQGCQIIQGFMKHWREVEHYDPANVPALTRYKAGDVWCPSHMSSSVDGPKYTNGKDKLWAIVRSTSLHQCGHFMMGAMRIGGARIGLSGSIGADGLPLDLQNVPKAWRARLVEVPENVAAIYWTDDGHNTIGKAAPDVRGWATAHLDELTPVIRGGRRG